MTLSPETQAKFQAFRAKLAQRKAQNEALKIASDSAKRRQLNAKTVALREAEARVLARIREQQRREHTGWIATANICVAQWQTCKCCGHETIATTGLFARQTNPYIPGATRLIEISDINPALETLTQMNGSALNRCFKCLTDVAHAPEQETIALLQRVLENPPMRDKSQLSLNLEETQ